jgi:cytidylate kinase
MPGVTISGGYGAGGSVIGPMVAERLGLQLLDRAISATVAAQLDVTVEEATAGAPNRSLVERLLTFMSPLANDALGTPVDPQASAAAASLTDEGAAFRDEAERIMREALRSGAVIVGRAGAAALRDEPDVLRVRLFGRPEARAIQGARLQGIELEVARERLAQVDRARDQYVRRLYRISVDAPEVFHLQLDSTVIPLDTCVEVIVTAYRGLLD